MKRLLVLVAFLSLMVPSGVAKSSTESHSDQGPSIGTFSILERTAEQIGIIIEAVGVLVIVIGTVVASGLFAHRLFRGAKYSVSYQDYRRNLGQAILLGLEFLLAADIVGTVVIAPTFKNLGVLGLIVLIRTALSFALEVEINGHWPWKNSEISMRSRD